MVPQPPRPAPEEHDDDEAFIGGEEGLPEGVEVLDDLEGAC
jgi:hypothetical protein